MNTISKFANYIQRGVVIMEVVLEILKALLKVLESNSPSDDSSAAA